MDEHALILEKLTLLRPHFKCSQCEQELDSAYRSGTGDKLCSECADCDENAKESASMDSLLLLYKQLRIFVETKDPGRPESPVPNCSENNPVSGLRDDEKERVGQLSNSRETTPVPMKHSSGSSSPKDSGVCRNSSPQHQPVIDESKARHNEPCVEEPNIELYGEQCVKEEEKLLFSNSTQNACDPGHVSSPSEVTDKPLQEPLMHEKDSEAMEDDPMDRPWPSTAPPIIVSDKSSEKRTFVYKKPSSAIKRYAPSPPTSGDDEALNAFRTPAKKLALEEIMSADRSGSGGKVIQISVEELTLLLQTAKKAGRDEMKTLLTSASKSIPKEESNDSFEEGITPLNATVAECEEKTIANSTLKRDHLGEDGDSEASEDSFVPPTPKSETKKVDAIRIRPSMMSTGLTPEDLAIVLTFCKQYNINLSKELSPLAGFLVAPHCAVTLKWLYARVKGIPILSMEWIRECMRNGSEVPVEKFYLEKPSSVPVVEFLKTLDVVLFPPFAKYSQIDLMSVLTAAGIKVSSQENWPPSANGTLVRRMILVDNCTVDDDQYLLQLSTLHCAPVVDISYVLGMLEKGQVLTLQPRLIVPMSDHQLSRLGFPAEVLTPEESLF